MGVLQYNYKTFSFSINSVVILCFVLNVCVTSANPHGHLHGILRSIKYGGGGGYSPTAIEGQPIVPFNGGGSYASSGSYAESNAASFSSSKSGSFNVGAVAPFGLGISMGVAGANSGSFAGAAGSSGSFAGNGNHGGIHSQASPYVAPTSSYNSPVGSGSYNPGSSAGSHASSGAVAGAASFGGAASNDQNGQFHNNAPPCGNCNGGINKQVNYGASVSYKDQQNNQNPAYDTTGSASTGSGAYGFAGASAGAASNAGAQTNYGAQVAPLTVGSGHPTKNANNGNFGNSGKDKTEGSVIITDVQKVPYNGATSGSSANAGAGGFSSYDSDYDRGFQTVVQPSKPAVTTMVIMKPDPKFPQTSYGYVPEGNTNINIDSSIHKKDHNVANKAPNSGFQSYDNTRPSSPPTYHEMKFIVTTDKKVDHGIGFGSSNSQANAQAAAGSFAGHIGSGAQHPVKDQPTFTNTGHVATDTGKYSGNFGGSPGVLGDQKPPGYAINKGVSHGVTIGASHSHGQSAAGSTSISGVHTVGAYPGQKETIPVDNGYNNVDSGKYGGSFGGSPGVLGNQRPPGYAVNKEVSHGVNIGVSQSHGQAGAGSTSFAGIQDGGVHPKPNQGNINIKGGPGKYSGSFGGGPGVLGDQKPPGYAVNKEVSLGVNIGASHSHAQAGAGSTSSAGVHVGGVHPTHNQGSGNINGGPGKYTGSFGGGPGVLGDQRPPGYAVNKEVSLGVNIGSSHPHAQAGAGSTSSAGVHGGSVHPTYNQGSGEPGKYTGSFGGGPGVLGDQRPPGYAVNKEVSHGVNVGASHSHAQAGAGSTSSAGTHTAGINPTYNQGSDNINGGPGKYTGSFGGGPGVLGDQRPPGYAIQGSHNVGSVASSNAHATASAGANAFAGTGTNTGHYAGAPGHSGNGNYNNKAGGIKTTTTFVDNNKDIAAGNHGFVGNPGANSNAGAYAGATANAGAIAGTGTYGQNPHGLTDQTGHYEGHVSHGVQKTQNYNGNHGGSYGAGNSGAYNGGGGIEIGIKKQGSIVGGIVGGMLNAIGSVAAAGSQALSSSHSASLGHGGLGISGGIASSYAAAGAHSGASAGSGCCG